MKVHVEAKLIGNAGIATEVVVDEFDTPAASAALSTWFLQCPRQSPAWEHYTLNVVHLREAPGVTPPVITVPGATHEILVVALDPETKPTADDPQSWAFLWPVNVREQFTVDDDEDAIELAKMAAQAVVNGLLPAEPALAGAVEPWRTAIIRTSAHLRGEEHAP